MVMIGTDERLPNRKTSRPIKKRRGRDIVVIETNTASVDAYGEPIESWSTFATVRGNILSIDQFESQDPGRVKSQSKHILSIRFVAGLDIKMRATHEGVVYAIESSIDPDSLGRELLLELRRK